MSLSGVGGGNPLVPNWSLLVKNRRHEPTTKSAETPDALGQVLAATAGATSGVQSVTGASGAQMNSQDSGSFGQAMSSLSDALQSGDVSAAQDAFAKLKSLLQSSGVHGHHGHHHGTKKTEASSTSGSAMSDNPLATAFGDLGQALQSGDLTGAQDAFSTLQGLLQNAPQRLTSPPPVVDGYATPSDGAIDLTA